MFWRILPHATLCIASDRLILLDVRQDRYLMMPDRIARDLRRWLEDEEATTAPTAIAGLLQQNGIWRQGDQQPTAARPLSLSVPPTLAAPQAPRKPGSARDVARVGALVTAAWLALRWRPLRSILRDTGRRQVPMRPGRSRGIPAAVGAYDRARIYVPFARRCLLDCLALHAWLRDHEEQSQLVFGVTGQPFAAHCWLQNADVILNDTYERVSRFTPILAI
ncbi:lasso peptide biosynthesis B2 protein [Sphingomonas sp. AR_OL41]|uniref:lasso peptide biosynthesis B2 protein n=1 Tax=Sphingomonas sp. AR_OL41 TaxID=3042729 RepID=UPI002480DF28|nr:lasso peptide biosynthesis B2 protein [Sphingomonas sp. AR_OL41]MDH7974489.1 lasso peptide biosynthesis B2 protein [Sphingomonas sp. AR_OL41]